MSAATVARLMRVLGSEPRINLLRWALDKRTFSPTEAATGLGVPLENMSYHVRVLRDAGLLELAGKSEARGAIIHHYRVTPAARRAERAVSGLAG